MNRRQFLELAGLSAAGFVVPPSITTLYRVPNKLYIPDTASAANLQFAETIIDFLIAFVANVAAEFVNKHVDDWIKALQDQSKTQEADTVKTTRDQMVLWGFNHGKQSTVNLLVDTVYCYPLVAADGFNCCATLLNNTFDSWCFAEGPTLLALGKAAKKINANAIANGADEQTAKTITGQMLVPQAKLSEGDEQSFYRPYSSEYKTLLGKIKLDYQSKGPEKGEVTLKAITDDDDKELDLLNETVNFPHGS